MLWALRTWLAAVNDKRTLDATPGDVAPLPSYLTNRSTATLVPYGHCHDGHVAFSNVPSGK